MEYTKGEWRVGSKSYLPWQVFVECDGRAVALTSEPDANLIAAAPQMYEALKEFELAIKSFNGLLLNCVPDSEIVGALDGMLDRAGALMDKAIDKAEGKDVNTKQNETDIL